MLKQLKFKRIRFRGIVKNYLLIVDGFVKSQKNDFFIANSK